MLTAMTGVLPRRSLTPSVAPGHPVDGVSAPPYSNFTTNDVVPSPPILPRSAPILGKIRRFLRFLVLGAPSDGGAFNFASERKNSPTGRKNSPTERIFSASGKRSVSHCEKSIFSVSKFHAAQSDDKSAITSCQTRQFTVLCLACHRKTWGAFVINASFQGVEQAGCIPRRNPAPRAYRQEAHRP